MRRVVWYTGRMATRNPGRQGRGHRRYKLIKKQQRARGLPCWICGGDIDYSVTDGSTELSFTYDHLEPWATSPELRFDPSNGASAHRKCNDARGKNEPIPELGTTSRAW